MFVVEPLRRVLALCRQRVRVEHTEPRISVAALHQPQPEEKTATTEQPPPVEAEQKQEDSDDDLSPEERARMSEPIVAGSVTLPFVRADFRRLALVERALLAKRAGTAQATADAPLSAAEEASLGAKVEQLATMVREAAEGEEEHWKTLVELDEGMLYRGLLAVLALVPLPPATFHALVQTLYVLSTLDPARVYRLAVAHPAAVDKLLLSISPELDAAELGARFRFLDLLLIEGAQHPEHPLPLSPDELEETIEELMECLANPSASIFALAATNLLLLDSIDGKRTLHRVLMGKQAQLASISPSQSAAAASEPRSPARRLTTDSLSRFSQELITLVNSGRLPPQWEDEGEVTRQHSGTDRARSGSCEDLFQSTRAEVRPPPERDPSCHPVTNAALSFLSQLFATNTALDLLYTNDISVLVEVMIRRLEDLSAWESPADIALTLGFLMCLSSVLSWPEYAENTFKLPEVRELLRAVAANFPPPPPPDEEEEETPEQSEERENRIAIHEIVKVMQTKCEKF